jgi:hypothetical protein
LISNEVGSYVYKSLNFAERIECGSVPAREEVSIDKPEWVEPTVEFGHDGAMGVSFKCPDGYELDVTSTATIANELLSFRKDCHLIAPD